MYKLNILPVSLLEKPVSKNNQVFSHEACDVCEKQGIKYEAISYEGTFDYNKLKYYNYTFKKYKEFKKLNIPYYAASDCYIIYYVCSKECATMLQFQLGD